MLLQYNSTGVEALAGSSSVSKNIYSKHTIQEGKNCNKNIYCDGEEIVSIIMYYGMYVSIFVRGTFSSGFSCN